MTITTYADTFWGGDLSSTAGYDALTKRNTEGKKICGELEEYLKKRSKLELDYSKSLSNLGRTFKDRETIGVLEATLNKLRCELDVMASSHSKAADNFSKQAERLEKFRKDQTNNRKGVEETLAKSQSSKFTQLSKTKQLEKTYVRRCLEKDAADANLRDMYTVPGVQVKEIEKARTKAAKAADDADKADSAYKSAVLVLEDCRVSWESEMEAACNAIQQLDEERITFMRQELWKSVNADSQIALDVDKSCEEVREILEKCDVISDIDAYINARGTGTERPEPFVYSHYSKLAPAVDSSSESSTDGSNCYSTYAGIEDSLEGVDGPGSRAKKSGFTFPRGILSLKK